MIKLRSALRSLPRMLACGIKTKAPKSLYDFKSRSDYHMERYHIPISRKDGLAMINTNFGFASEHQFVNAVIPKELQFRAKQNFVHMHMPELAEKFEKMMEKNRIAKCHIGQGFYPCYVPAIVQRCILENPRWYTAYTPYQPEIAQGRLEALFNYQVMVKRITEMEFANGSLLDEASAAGEAMLMAWRIAKRQRKTFIVSSNIYDASLAVINSYANELGISVIVADVTDKLIEEHKADLFGVILQTPDKFGTVYDYGDVIAKVHANAAIAIVGTDLLGCTVLKTPGAMGADIAYGNGQRFGTPMGYGGPHAAFFASKLKYIRETPGRIIGIAKDAHGNDAYRISLTTREQHIKRDKATSNICTSQVLLANLNFFYALFHGEEGLNSIARRINFLTQNFVRILEKQGLEIVNHSPESVNYFDTVTFKVPDAQAVVDSAAKKGINLWKVGDDMVSVSFNETSTLKDVINLGKSTGKTFDKYMMVDNTFNVIDESLARTNFPIFKPTDIFNKVNGEHDILRYMTQLESKDVTLANSMIPLGSCTMKLNSAFNMQFIGHPKLDIHPYAPLDNAKGYHEMMVQMSHLLLMITNMDAISYQSNSGATGEYVGLACIKRYHEANSQGHRNVVLIPSSAHGTNPASAAKMGLKIVDIKTLPTGYIDVEDLKTKVSEHKDNMFGMMITYPSTHGVFEENTLEVVGIVREAGGLIYIDGANVNAQMFISAPGVVGDVCHLNLHKTFTIPHGGGGPGVGPVCVKAFLKDYLPSHPYCRNASFDAGKSIPSEGFPISASPFGSASILSIVYLYLKSSGLSTLRRSAIQAMINSNYLRIKLEPHYKVLYTNQKGLVAHEFILDIRPIKKACGVTEEDIAKRLMDYGFHAPTQSFPVAGTLMVEPTESESIEELDRFVEAMVAIRREISKVESGEYDPRDNPLKNAPHTVKELTANEWTHKYSREEAAFPVEYLKRIGKVWPAVKRIDSLYGDRNLRLDYE